MSAVCAKTERTTCTPLQTKVFRLPVASETNPEYTSAIQREEATKHVEHQYRGSPYRLAT
jgi:hypothetical protein